MKQLKDCKNVLDVCGGTGRIAEYLTRLGKEVKVVDLSKEMLSIAKDKGLNTEIQDATNLKEASNSYDAVTCLGNSLGGLLLREDRLKAIKEMARVSKGYVLIDCNNRLAKPLTWLPVYVRKLLGYYRQGLRLGKDVVTGLELGDIVYYDSSLNQGLYHYTHSALELKKMMKKAGLKVRIIDSALSSRPVLIGQL